MGISAGTLAVLATVTTVLFGVGKPLSLMVASAAAITAAPLIID